MDESFSGTKTSADFVFIAGYFDECCGVGVSEVFNYVHDFVSLGCGYHEVLGIGFDGVVFDVEEEFASGVDKSFDKGFVGEGVIVGAGEGE